MTTDHKTHLAPITPMDYYQVDPADIEAFYAKAAAAGVYAPLDPGELDSMEDRLAGRVVWKREWDKTTQRYIDLVVPWLGTPVSGPLHGQKLMLEPGSYRVTSLGAAHFHVEVQGVEVALIHSQR